MGGSVTERELPGGTRHRTWPAPERRPLLRMTWHDLLFLHRPVAPASLRPLLPAALELDTFDGRAWLGIVPFRMTDVRPTFLPSRLALAFPEINVRTYVRSGDRGGVWFFSLDAASRLAVRAARRWFGLPYFDAGMSARREDGEIRYRSVRTHRGAPPAAFHATYRPTGPVDRAAPGSLAHFLTERYRLYARDGRGRLRHGDIHHAPWPLQPAEAEVRRDTMADLLGPGLGAGRGAPLLHFARRLDVVAWGPETGRERNRRPRDK